MLAWEYEIIPSSEGILIGQLSRVFHSSSNIYYMKLQDLQYHTTTPNSEIQFLAAGFFLVMFRVVLIVYSSFYPYCSISYGSSNEKASHLLGIFARFAFFAQSGGWKTNHHIGEN